MYLYSLSNTDDDKMKDVKTYKMTEVLFLNSAKRIAVTYNRMIKNASMIILTIKQKLLQFHLYVEKSYKLYDQNLEKLCNKTAGKLLRLVETAFSVVNQKHKIIKKLIIKFLNF